MRFAELEMMVDEFSDESREDFISRLADMVTMGAMTMEEARRYVERVLPPRIFAFPGTPPEIVIEAATPEQIEGMTASPLEVSPVFRGHEFPELNVPETPIVETVINRMVERGYDRDKLLHGLSAERKRELIRLHGLDDPSELNVSDEFMRRLYAEGHTIQRITEIMREEGYEPDVLIHGGEPMQTVRGLAGEDVERGDLVTIDEEGVVRPADGERPIGIALDDELVQLEGAFRGAQEAVNQMGGSMSWAREYGSMMVPMHASIAYGGRWGTDLGVEAAELVRRQQARVQRGPGRYQFNERFSDEVKAKAMKLLEKFMNAEQYKAFLEGSNIELENKAEDHRVMINRSGVFMILKGPRGAGITMSSGNVRSYKYPLGDEIAVFLDWFNHRTEELIERWRCGTYGIVDDGKLR